MNKYSNERVDELLDAALQTTDQEQRKEYYYEFQQILADEVPAPIIYFRRTTRCWNNRLHEHEPNAIDWKWNVNRWWVER
jgi:peptide/nickel transport system substrate-binding protein